MDYSSPVMRFCRRMQSVAKLFRFVELFIALAFLSWLSSRLPFAVRISGEYCRRFSLLIFSPISIFLLGNVIVLTLLAKSGLFSGNASLSIDNAVAELYDELRSGNPDESIAPAAKEEIVYQDKEIICEQSSKIANPKAIDEDDDDRKLKFPEKEVETKVSYRRSKSENLRRESEEKEMSNLKLRRSETDIRRKEFAGGDDAAEESSDDDDLSNEEFQQTIEAFIAKQIRFHREERLAVVLHGQA